MTSFPTVPYSVNVMQFIMASLIPTCEKQTVPFSEFQAYVQETLAKLTSCADQKEFINQIQVMFLQKSCRLMRRISKKIYEYLHWQYAQLGTCPEPGAVKKNRRSLLQLENVYARKETSMGHVMYLVQFKGWPFKVWEFRDELDKNDLLLRAFDAGYIYQKKICKNFGLLLKAGNILSARK